MELLRDVARQVGPVDLLDIALVSAVIYVALAWLRGSIPESALRRILVAAPVAAGVYILVRIFDLYLLETVVRVLFIVLIIAAVVVFQSDIRRIFDRATAARFGRERLLKSGVSATDTLTSAVMRMAEQHIGALIVLEGREPIDIHMHGGIELNGLLSEPLLLGIFDPDTPGHDGALILSEDRVTHFAVHLPLASDVPEVSRYGGTRHAAAVGVSEVSDALVIVVSEERGTVGIAEDGRIDVDLAVADVKKRLEAFWNERHEQKSAAETAWWRRPSLQTAGVSFMLAVSFWLLVVYSPNTVIRSLTVPIEIRNLPEGWALEGELPAEAQVVISGSEQVFRRLNEPELTISVDASEPVRGRKEIILAESDLNLPAGIDLTRIEPPLLLVNFRRLTPITLPVVVRTSGNLPADLILASAESDPDSVTILVSDDRSQQLEHLETQDVDLADIEEDGVVRSRVVLPEGAILPPGRTRDVMVEIDVDRPEDEAAAGN